jgi:hypothetical protein
MNQAFRNWSMEETEGVLVKEVRERHAQIISNMGVA